MSATVATLGSGGYVGQATLAALAKTNLTVKAGFRKPDSDKAKDSTKADNITPVALTMGDKESLIKGLAGVDVAFINTPGHIDRTKITVDTVAAAKEAGVKHLVVVSVLTAEKVGTCFGDQFKAIEGAVKDSGVNYTLLRLPLFIDNQWGNAGSIKGQSKIYNPIAPDIPHSTVATADVGEVVAAIAQDPAKYVNKTFNLTSPSYTQTDVAKAFSAALGRDVEYVQVPNSAAKEAMMGMGMPEWQADGVVELLDLINAKDPVMNQPNEDIKSILGRPGVTIEEWTKSVAAGFK